MEANFVQTSRSGSKTRRWPGKGRRKAAVSVAGGGEERVEIIYTPTRRQEKKTPQKPRQKKENVQTQQLLLATNNRTSAPDRMLKKLRFKIKTRRRTNEKQSKHSKLKIYLLAENWTVHLYHRKINECENDWKNVFKRILTQLNNKYKHNEWT